MEIKDLDALLGVPVKTEPSKRPGRLRVVPAVPQHSEITSIVDVYLAQTCQACGCVDFLHAGRMIEEQGPRCRILRKPNGLEPKNLLGLPYKREFQHSEIPLCKPCSDTLVFADEAVGVLSNGSRQMEFEF